MMQPPAPSATPATLPMIEILGTCLIIGLAFLMPHLGGSWFRSIERLFKQLAIRRGLSVAAVGAAALLLRIAILPFCPVPLPFVPDDFSFLLAADTFEHGRLANPMPAMWMHFESIHLTTSPTYMSMYFPGQGLVLAAGHVLFGHPWYGLLIVSALMCAAICWMLQAWLPPTWALLGGLMAVLHLGLFSYWVNSYHAAGGIAALGGALVLGAFPRLIKTSSMRYGLLLAIGISLLILTRPYEGLLLCLPVAVVLGRWALFGKNRPSALVLVRRAAFPLALVIATGSWLAYYDYRAFGSPTTLPYTVDRAEYAIAPYYVWQSQRPEPAYRHASMRAFYRDGELRFFVKIHSMSGFIPQTLLKAGCGIEFFAGFALLPPLFMLHRAVRDRRVRLLVIGLSVMAAGMVIQIFCLPHYLAPFTAAFYAIGLQAARHLRFWQPDGKPVGMALSRFCVTLCIVMAGLRLGADSLHIPLYEWPPGHWNFVWYGPGHFGEERAQIQANLEQQPGKQLVLVRYRPDHEVLEEWVYNLADIDGSKVIWAREMDEAHNRELLAHYPDRHVWLVQPDATTSKLSNYVLPDAKPVNTMLASNITPHVVQKRKP